MSCISIWYIGEAAVSLSRTGKDQWSRFPHPPPGSPTLEDSEGSSFSACSLLRTPHKAKPMNYSKCNPILQLVQLRFQVQLRALESGLDYHFRS